MWRRVRVFVYFTVVFFCFGLGGAGLSDFILSVLRAVVPCFFPSRPSYHPAYPALLIAGITGLGIASWKIVHWRRSEKTQAKHLKSEQTPVDDTGLRDQLKVAKFFLDLYKKQIQPDEGAACNLIPIGSPEHGKTQTFELRIRQKGEWSTRRLSLGRIGDNSKSRSKCYYVIYDDHLVIKLPKKPITDINEYFRLIYQDREIARQLHPIKSIIPTVSTLLSKVHSFYHVDGTAKDVIEKKYIEWIRFSPEQHHHLKIESSFVFFMELSQYYFLGYVVDLLHRSDASLIQRLAKNPDTLWNINQFEDQFGAEYTDIWHDLQDLFSQFQQAVQSVELQKNITFTIPPNKLQHWFQLLISRTPIETPAEIPEATFSAHFTPVFNAFSNKHKHLIDTYTDRVIQKSREISFVRNRPKMAAIITNLMDLLVEMGEKHVAMRDLKPDNLIIIGDPEDYPGFLLRPEDFSIGIIDLETAVITRVAFGEEIKQPKLGGTPFYATPSHLMLNSMLRSYYTDLEVILRMQDWFAMIGIIFRIITSEHVFIQTSRELPKLQHQILKGHGRPEAIRYVNSIFWPHAKAELTNRTDTFKSLLEAVCVPLSLKVASKLELEIFQSLKILSNEIKQRINTQQIFRNSSVNAYLLKSSVNELKHWQNRHADKLSQHPQASLFLDRLVMLKEKEGIWKQRIARLRQNYRVLTAYELMFLLFDVVSRHMDIPSEKTYHEKNAKQTDE